MQYLILADIHANLALFRASSMMRKQRDSRNLVPGDIVGYGPDPHECISY